MSKPQPIPFSELAKAAYGAHKAHDQVPWGALPEFEKARWIDTVKAVAKLRMERRIERLPERIERLRSKGKHRRVKRLERRLDRVKGRLAALGG